jgi:hypothetical protein
LSRTSTTPVEWGPSFLKVDIYQSPHAKTILFSSIQHETEQK